MVIYFSCFQLWFLVEYSIIFFVMGVTWCEFWIANQGLRGSIPRTSTTLLDKIIQRAIFIL